MARPPRDRLPDDDRPPVAHLRHHRAGRGRQIGLHDHRPHPARQAGDRARRGDVAVDADPRRRLRRARSSACSATRAPSATPFHITSDEWLTWDQILRLVGRAAGVRAADRPRPERVHRQAGSRHGRRAARRQELERAVRQREDQELRPRLARADPVRRGDPRAPSPGSTPIPPARPSTRRPTRASTRSCAPGNAERASVARSAIRDRRGRAWRLTRRTARWRRCISGLLRGGWRWCTGGGGVGCELGLEVARTRRLFAAVAVGCGDDTPAA